MAIKLKFYLYQILFVTIAYSLTSAEEIGSPLKVAQCRATCVHTFSKKNEPFPLCLKKKDCLSCWKSCQQLQSSFNKLCSQNINCGAGCEAACKFMDSGTSAQRAPVLVRRGEEVLMIKDQETRWPAPAPELDGPWVYLVMRRMKNTWRQITQTLDLSAKIPTGGMVRVLVVGKDGLVTIYGPAEEVGQVEDKGWHLREVSVIHQEAVVIAEVAWESRRPRSLYLVTWEVAGGGLRGNLLTSSTCVALSLWPDTLFHVQVELMNPGSTQPEKSEELVIDTQKTNDDGTILSEEPNESKDDEAISTTPSLLLNRLTNGTTSGDLLDAVVTPKRMTQRQFRKNVFVRESAMCVQPTPFQIQLLAGMFAAFTVFLILIIWRWRNRMNLSPHVKLIEDEFLNSDHFKVVTDKGKEKKDILIPTPHDAVT